MRSASSIASIVFYNFKYFSTIQPISIIMRNFVTDCRKQVFSAKLSSTS